LWVEENYLKGMTMNDNQTDWNSPTVRDEITQHFLIAALWTADESVITPKPGIFDPSPHLPLLTDAARTPARSVVDDFISWVSDTLSATTLTSAQVGHYLLLTAHGAGVGFHDVVADGQLTEFQANKLHFVANRAAAGDIMLGDDGMYNLE
jgi:hypothetical protein